MDVLEFLKYTTLLLTCLIDSFIAFEFYSIFCKRRNAFQKKRYVVLLYFVSAFSVFGLNLLYNLIVNLLSSLVIIVCCIIIYDVKILKGILFGVIVLVIIIGSELIVTGLLLIDSITMNLDYSLLLDQVMNVGIVMLIKFTILIVVKKIFSSNISGMRKSTFMFYLMVPVASILMLLLLSVITVNVEKTQEISIALSVYAIITIFQTFFIFYSFHRHTQDIQTENELRDKQIKSDSDNVLLYISAKAMRNRLAVVEGAMEQDRIIRHDRRHFEGLLLELLKNGNASAAQEMLEKRIAAEPKKIRKWCDNEIINATFEYYVTVAEKSDIKISASLNIPKDPGTDSLQLAITIGNLLENAIIANRELPEEERFIRVKAIYKRQLLISIENACSDKVVLNSEGHPFSTKKGHGIGTKSVLAFAEKTQSDVLYSVENGVFTVQLMIGC